MGFESNDHIHNA